MPIVKGLTKSTNVWDAIKTHGQFKQGIPQQGQQQGVEQGSPPVAEPQRPVDRTLLDNGYWERGTFTVPEDVSDERVQFHADKYKARLGKVLNLQGFVVKEMLPPVVSTRLPEPGRKRYDILAFVTRKPVTLHLDIPDKAVPEMQKRGMKLNE